MNGNQQFRSLGANLGPDSRKQSQVPVLNGVTSDSDILADPALDFGPCLNDEGETDARVGFHVRPCNLAPHLPVGPARYPARLDTMQLRCLRQVTGASRV